MAPSSTPRRQVQTAAASQRRRTTTSGARDLLGRPKLIPPDVNPTPRRPDTTTVSKAVRARPNPAQVADQEHILNRHVVSNLTDSPGGTPKSRNPPKAPVVERGDGLRHMTEAEMSGQYTFNRQIGCGNWASVWIVQPKRSAGVKAMKIVHRASQSGALQRFNALVNEYKILQAIGKNTPWNENVVRFEDFLLTPTYACLVMPYYDVQMTVCLPFAACRVYFSKMAMALKWLHDNYITHNDIKLANTLVKHSAGDRYGQPVLVDFGFARNHAPGRGTNFLSSESWGTPEYLSPERMVGDVHDERLSDLWSLGVSFFEMATGRTPFEKKDETFTTPALRNEYYRRTVQGHWYSDNDLPFEVEDLCRSIVQLIPSKRMQVPEMLQHQFFRSAREGHVDGMGKVHLNSGWDSEEDTSQQTCSIVSEMRSLSPSPSDVEIVETCRQVGRRLTFQSASPKEEDTSTVPFPSSPSLEPAATSFGSNLVRGDPLWSLRINSEVTRAHLGPVESPLRGHAAEEFCEVGSCISDLSTRGIKVKTQTDQSNQTSHPSSKVAQTTVDDSLALASTGGTASTKTPARAMRGGPSIQSLHRRPGAPTPSRFRGAVVESAVATSNIQPSDASKMSDSKTSGQSPIRYVGSLKNRYTTRSMLPLPTRLSSKSRALTTSDPPQPPAIRAHRLGSASGRGHDGHHQVQGTQERMAPPRYGSIVEILEDTPSLTSASEEEIEPLPNRSNVASQAQNPSQDGEGYISRSPVRVLVEVSTMTNVTTTSQASLQHIKKEHVACAHVSPPASTGPQQLLERLQHINSLVSELAVLTAQCASDFARYGQALPNGQSSSEKCRGAEPSLLASALDKRQAKNPPDSRSERSRSPVMESSSQPAILEYGSTGREVDRTKTSIKSRAMNPPHRDDCSQFSSTNKLPDQSRVSRRATLTASVYGRLSQAISQTSPTRARPALSEMTILDTPRSAKRKEQGYQSFLKEYGIEKRGKGLQGQRVLTPVEDESQQKSPASLNFTLQSRSAAARVLRRIKANGALNRRDIVLKAAHDASVLSDASSLLKTTPGTGSPGTSVHSPSGRSSEKRSRHMRSRSALIDADRSSLQASVASGVASPFYHRSVDLDRGNSSHIGDAPRRVLPVTPGIIGSAATLPLWKKLRGAVKEVQQRTI